VFFYVHIIYIKIKIEIDINNDEHNILKRGKEVGGGEGMDFVQFGTWQGHCIHPYVYLCYSHYLFQA
jgi:hypothetical protein